MQSYGKWRPPDFDLSIRVLGMETRNQKKKTKIDFDGNENSNGHSFESTD